MKHRTALAAILFSLGCVAVAQEDARDTGKIVSREPGVLAVLRRLDPLQKQWLGNSTFEVVRTPLGTQVLPRIPISCGNSMMGVMDASRARGLARELFAVYRLEAKADVKVNEHGVEAVLDGYDAGRKVGFELRGLTTPQPTMFAGALPEEPRTGLSDEELAKLQQAGIRVYAVDLKDFPLMDADYYTPTLAYLAGVVGFLDEVTDGSDVPLDAVLWQRQQQFPIGVLPSANGVIVQDAGNGLRVVQVAETVTLTLPIDGSGCQERISTEVHAWKWTARAQPIATAGQPTRVTMSISAELTGSTMRVMQKIGDGSRVDVEAPGTSVLMPGEFDAAKPFSLVLKLEPGTYYVYPHVGVGCPRR